MAAQLVVVRASDLVVLGVEYDGCTLEPGRLRADGVNPTLSVTFGPQSIGESLAPDADGSGTTYGARLAAPSRLTIRLAAGEVVGLDLPGLLTALTTHGVVSDASTLELPFGLELRPRSGSGTLLASAPVEVVAGPGAADDRAARATALWQLVLADDTDPSGSAVLAEVVGAPERAEVGQPAAPHPVDRGLLRYTGGTAQLTRLRLSALGGTLTSTLRNSSVEWDHDLALGRDRRVRVLQAGVLHPFGHRAVVETVTERRIGDDGVAALRETTQLRVLEPVRVYPEDGSLESREFPFHAAEVLGSTTLDVSLTAVRTWTAPPGWDPYKESQLAAKRAEIDAAQTALDEAYPAPMPTTVDEVLASSWAPAGAGDVEYQIEQERTNLASIMEAIAQAQAEARAGTGTDTGTGTGTGRGTDGPPVDLQTLPPPGDPGSGEEAPVYVDAPPSADDSTWAPALLWQAKLESEARLNALYVQRGELREQAVAILDDLNARVAAGRADITRLGAELTDLARTLGDYTPAVVSSIHDVGGAEHPFTVRLSGRLGHVVVTTPLLLLHDVRVPAIEGVEEYRSLDDPLVTFRLPLGPLSIQPTVVDLVRRAGPPATTDLQEVHALSVSDVRHDGGTVRPVLGDLALSVVELRALLPDLDGLTTGRLSSAFISTGDPSVPLELDPVAVDFAGHAERGGGLVLPSFTADRISQAYGPVSGAMLPGPDADPRAALAAMRLFGLSLLDLLADLDLPPAITQVLDDGLPRGVRMTWDRRLHSHEMFVAHAPGETTDTTALALTVEQGLDSSHTSCTVSAFSLALPDAGNRLVGVDVGGLAFTMDPGRPPHLDLGSVAFDFGGALQFLASLQERAGLGGLTPRVDVHDDGIAASYTLTIPSAPAAGFTMTGISFTVAVWVPFRAGVPRVDLDFASPSAPFELVVPPFGGSGYLGIGVDATGLRRVVGSLEFGGSASVDFLVVTAEVHVRAGAHIEYDGSAIAIAGFLHIGGSVELLGLVSVAVDLRVELTYHSDPARLSGRATLVIEIDLTLYSDSVELDSGDWTFIGGDSDRHDARELGAGPIDPQAWDDYQAVYA